jgi:RNA polymerase sigma-70 factor, ECF subfamily
MSAAEASAPARALALTDEELVDLLRAGDADAYPALLRRYNRRVYRAIRSILDDEAEIEDVMQDAYLAAYRSLPGFEGRARFSTWLIRIAVNRALDVRRRAGRALALDEPSHGRVALEPPPVEFLDPERQLGARDLARRLERAIDTLPPPYRTVYVLRELEGLGTFDTAECLDLEPATVRTRFHRARALLRVAVGADVVAAAEVMGFGGERCARISAAVVARIA